MNNKLLIIIFILLFPIGKSYGEYNPSKKNEKYGEWILSCKENKDDCSIYTKGLNSEKNILLIKGNDEKYISFNMINKSAVNEKNYKEPPKSSMYLSIDDEGLFRESARRENLDQGVKVTSTFNGDKKLGKKSIKDFLDNGNYIRIKYAFFVEYKNIQKTKHFDDFSLNGYKDAYKKLRKIEKSHQEKELQSDLSFKLSKDKTKKNDLPRFNGKKPLEIFKGKENFNYSVKSFIERYNNSNAIKSTAQVKQKIREKSNAGAYSYQFIGDSISIIADDWKNDKMMSAALLASPKNSLEGQQFMKGVRGMIDASNPNLTKNERAEIFSIIDLNNLLEPTFEKEITMHGVTYSVMAVQSLGMVTFIIDNDD